MSIRLNLRMSSTTKKTALAGFFLLVIFLCFWPFRFENDSAVWDRLMDACHIPLFGSVALVLYWNIPNSGCYGWRHALKTGFLTCLMAALVEVIQPYTGRTESFDDFRNGFFGVVIALAAIPVWLQHKRWFSRFLHLVFTVLITAFVLQPAWQEWKGIQWRKQNFPLLGDFETPIELKLWTSQGGSDRSWTELTFSTEYATHGSHSLRIQTGVGNWAGVSYAAGVQDWSNYTSLAFEIYNPGASFTLGIRVDDDVGPRNSSSRFSRQIELAPGPTKITISVHDLQQQAKPQPLHVQGIRRLALFTGEQQNSRVFYLDNVRLE